MSQVPGGKVDFLLIRPLAESQFMNLEGFALFIVGHRTYRKTQGSMLDPSIIVVLIRLLLDDMQYAVLLRMLTYPRY